MTFLKDLTLPVFPEKTLGISPLLWRIFYDPLLCRIAEDESLSYTISVNWPTGNLKMSTTYSLRTAGLAYADDTVWIGHSHSNAQRIVDIFKEFFNINDLDINGYKSFVLVINLPKSTSRKESYIRKTRYEGLFNTQI